MACLSCHSLTRTLVFVTVSSNINSPSPQSNSDATPPIAITKPKTKTKTTTTLPRKKSHQTKLQQQLNLLHIERAIGAGSYRDTEPRDLELNSAGELEGPLERKLREAGEWFTNKTENEFRSSGKGILMFVFQWILPIYMFTILVAAGVIKLPFSTPQLDDLIM